MKLQKVLTRLNLLEKNAFLKIIDSLIEESPKNKDKINEILSGIDERDRLKNMDVINIVRVFNLLEDEYKKYLEGEIAKPNSQLDLVTDIIIRDGNCVMKFDWLAKLYEKVIKDFETKRKEFCQEFMNEQALSANARCRDYNIYQACLETAYNNDIRNNLDKKITADEHSILETLSQQLLLSQDEVKTIKYTTIPLVKQPVEDVINELKNAGIAFFSKKMNTLFIADEIVMMLRKIRGKEIADKFFRRFLKTLKPNQIRRICRNHNLSCKDLSMDEMIKQVIDNGVSFSNVLSEDIHSPQTNITDRKKLINEIWEKNLRIKKPFKGTTLPDKVQSLITYFEEIESDDKVSISFDGYDKLLKDFTGTVKDLNEIVKKEFELQDNTVLNSDYLVDYNIKPRDVIDIIPDEELKAFCEQQGIKTRGDIVRNILDAYTDAENIKLENYEYIGYRDLAMLKKNGLEVRDIDLGALFEDLTKSIFKALNFNVDEVLRKELNTKKDKIDIVLNLGQKEIIIIECKTVKEKGYNKFSTVSRQMNSYVDLATKKEYRVAKVLLVAPDFSDDFVNSCRLDYNLNLSLIQASSLLKIMECFKDSKLKEFPLNLFRKDVLISEVNVLKAIGK